LFCMLCSQWKIFRSLRCATEWEIGKIKAVELGRICFFPNVLTLGGVPIPPSTTADWLTHLWFWRPAKLKRYFANMYRPANLSTRTSCLWLVSLSTADERNVKREEKEEDNEV
jgi:hypothetical protein